MTLIKSISGMRGTIGGKPGDNLTPVDLIAFTSAYGTSLKKQNARPKVVIGRDGRITGASVQQLVMHTLVLLGIDVITLDHSTTPTVEVMVTETGADGGIIITASHNPMHWNALKFLNAKGEFISAETGAEILRAAEASEFTYASIDALGKITRMEDAEALHIRRILELDLVDAAAVREAGFHVVVDAINSTGAIAIPALLKELGCTYEILNGEISGSFNHNPEPLPAHLHEICETVPRQNAHIGFVVDPDVDRLAFVDERGKFFGEEYTLVAVADYILQHTPGATVSNMSSSMALSDLTAARGQDYHSAPVGEVNVVLKMKEVGAVIGGEGNGGVIYPALHYGRDALVGIALILTYMAKSGKTLSQLKAGYPAYHISKNKINLDSTTDVDAILASVQKHYNMHDVDTRDGVKVSFERSWVHLRKSNTEPIIRIYAESNTAESAERLCTEVKEVIAAISVS